MAQVPSLTIRDATKIIYKLYIIYSSIPSLNREKLNSEGVKNMKTLTKERSDELMLGPKHVSSGHICLYKKQNKSRAIWISSKGEVSALQLDKWMLIAPHPPQV